LHPRKGNPVTPRGLEPATFRFARAISTIEEALVDLLALVPVCVDPRFQRGASLRGTMRRTPVELTVRTYTGVGARFARVMTVLGGAVELVDLLVVPPATSGAPILTIELESIDRERGYVIADLITMVDDGASLAAQLAEQARRRPAMVEAEALPGLVPMGELPAWRAAWGSPRPLHAQVHPGHPASASRAIAAYAGAYAALARDPQRRPALDVIDRHSGYLRDRLARDPICGVIGRAFGHELATELASRVLFPRRLPG
jgi:hypothetical protein